MPPLRHSFMACGIAFDRFTGRSTRNRAGGVPGLDLMKPHFLTARGSLMPIALICCRSDHDRLVGFRAALPDDHHEPRSPEPTNEVAASIGIPGALSPSLSAKSVRIAALARTWVW